MRLNPVSFITFFISLIVAAAALASHMGFLPLPSYLPSQTFWLAMIGYVILMLGSLLRGM